MQAQFKSAEAGAVPFAVILGEDEQAQGQCKIKELGLPEGHPEKDGVVVALTDLVKEVKARLGREVSRDVDDVVEGVGRLGAGDGGE